MVGTKLGKRYERELGYYSDDPSSLFEESVVYRRAKSQGDIEDYWEDERSDDSYETE